MKTLPSYKDIKKQFRLSKKIGQFFMPAAFINDSEDEIQKLEKLIKQHNIGSLCFFHSRASAATNYEGKKEVIFNAESIHTLKSLIRRYQKASEYPLLIAIDAEWGLAMRIENTPHYPYAITLGAIQKQNELIFEVGKNIAQDCKFAGIHWNLAPCIDINNNPNNPVIGYRSFGENKEQVAEKALAFVKGTNQAGVLTSIKHFPGHGDTDTDSHLGLPLINKSKEELIANELYPFQKLIDEGVDSVMVGHLSVPALSNGKKIASSISKDIIKGLLRNQMGFKGIVISDALNMHAISKNYPTKGELEWMAFDAGNDILCFAEHIKEGIETIQKNANTSQIEESFKRIWQLKESVFCSKNLKENEQLELSQNDPLNKIIAEKSISLLHGSDEIIANFRKTNFCTLTLKRYKDQDNSNILANLKTMTLDVAKEDHILLLITPPQEKPVDNFGFLKEEIDFINHLIIEKNIVVYVFGNPYFFSLLNFKKTLATVAVYQDFKVFQDTAARHFLGDLKVSGKLPVTV